MRHLRLFPRLRSWMRKRQGSRQHVPSDMSEAIREGVGPRVVEGPAGLNTNLFDRVLDKDQEVE